MDDKAQEKEKEKPFSNLYETGRVHHAPLPEVQAELAAFPQEDWDFRDFGLPGRTRTRRIARELGRDE